MRLSETPVFSRTWLPLTLAGCLSACVYMFLQDYVSMPWIDEIGTADTAVNYVLYGKWDSTVWHYTYNPLHAFVLIGWLRIFGISHVTVCNLNVFLALLGYLYLENELLSKKIITKTRSGIALIALYWSGFMIASIITKGRIDILVMLLSIILVGKLLQTEFGIGDAIVMFCDSVLLMMSSIYVIPLLAIVILFFLIVDFQSQSRRIWFEKGLITALGFFMGFALTCCFYFKVNFLYHYLSTFFTFNDTIQNGTSLLSRIANAYKFDIAGLCLCLLAWCVVFVEKIKNKHILTLLVISTLIPFIMTVIGRYATYYVWMVELSVSVILVSLFDNTRSKKIINLIVISVTVLSLMRPAYWINRRPEDYRKRMVLYSFMESNKETIKKYDNVFFRDATCYYKVVEYGLKRYYLNNDNLLVNTRLVDIFSGQKYFSNYSEYYPAEFLPEEGIMISTPDWEKDEGICELKNMNYEYEVITQNEQYSLTRYKKRTN